MMLEFQSDALNGVENYQAIKIKTHFALIRCYEVLKETNVCLELDIQTCAWAETKRATSCDAHERASSSLECHVNLVSRLEKKYQAKENSKDFVFWPTSLEASLCG